MKTPDPIEEYVYTGHARTEMKRRGLESELVERVLKQPQQRFEVRTGRDVLQSKIPMAEGTYLLRVFVDVDRTPCEIVTVYRTSKIEKYWGSGS